VLKNVRVWLRRVLAAIALVLSTVLVIRAVDAWRAPPLKLWHTEVPQELDADDIDNADWSRWLAAEDAAFDEVRTRITDQLPAEDRVPSNRFFIGSPMHAAKFPTNWNRSYVLTPDGTPRGAVVLLHGLTDSPYSLRHLATHYRERGFVAVGIRLPGHGLAPAALAEARWQDWLAATRLAVRRARELAPGAPLHLAGYSNGGALALKYTLDAMEDPKQSKPDQLVLVSPMIGITSMAKFSGVLGWPAIFPPFAKAAWLEIYPEYNPFKYTSFPVNGPRQSAKLLAELTDQLDALESADGFAKLPPVLTFQSALDTTVSIHAIFDKLYARLPENGSALVFFDRNGRSDAGALLAREYLDPLAAIPPQPRAYSVTVIGTGQETAGTQELIEHAARQDEESRTVAYAYPANFYSLSHVALPFPVTDGLYGTEPAANEDFGVHLGTVAVRGERGTLVVSNETLMRATCNPFFGYLLERIDSTLP
jgi:alpha-beta hydrolase superfamily lysophospholipase